MNYALYKQQHTQEIITLFNDTFSDSEGKEEGALIAKLTEDFFTLPANKEDLYIFVAQDENERIVGSIFFSRLTFPNGENIFLLAPVAVATDCHGQGIGQGLIQFGLETLKEKGVTVAMIKEKTGLEEKQIRNFINRAKRQERIKNKARGIYISSGL